MGSSFTIIYSFIQQVLEEVGSVPGTILAPGAPEMMMTWYVSHVGYLWSISLIFGVSCPLAGPARRKPSSHRGDIKPLPSQLISALVSLLSVLPTVLCHKGLFRGGHS